MRIKQEEYLLTKQKDFLNLFKLGGNGLQFCGSANLNSTSIQVYSQSGKHFLLQNQDDGFFYKSKINFDNQNLKVQTIGKPFKFPKINGAQECQDFTVDKDGKLTLIMI